MKVRPEKIKFKGEEVKSPWLVSTEDTNFHTIIGDNKWEKAGWSWFQPKAKEFVRCTRKLFNLLREEKTYCKPAMLKKYGLSSTLFNSAETTAEAMELSRQECFTDAYTLYLRKLDKLYWRCTKADDKQLEKLARSIGRLHKKFKRTKHSYEHPILKPKLFRKQPHKNDKQGMEAWTKKWQERDEELICVGDSNEVAGNREFRIEVDYFTEVAGYFKVFRNMLHICTVKFPTKEALELLSILSFEEDNKCIPLTFHFRKEKGVDKIHLSWKYQYEIAKPTTEFYLGIDLNEITLMWGLLSNKIGQKIDSGIKCFPIDEDSQTRKQRLCKVVDEILEVAVKHKACVVLENLDFEGAKIGDSMISKVLHRMPYRTIRSIFVRKCLEQGVPIRFVKPQLTSVLGALYPLEQRDVASALIIALKASIQGLKLIHSMSKRPRS